MDKCVKGLIRFVSQYPSLLNVRSALKPLYQLLQKLYMIRTLTMIACARTVHKPLCSVVFTYSHDLCTGTRADAETCSACGNTVASNCGFVYVRGSSTVFLSPKYEFSLALGFVCETDDLIASPSAKS